ncbi:MAG: DUF3048 domain-containing protein [Candidatus Saccharibacteria bacterium]
MKSIEKKHIWRRFTNWISVNRKKVLIIGGIVLVLAAAAVTVIILFLKPAAQTEQSNANIQIPIVVEPIKYYSKLTGSLVPTEAATKQAVTAIMIENSPDARPQSGLKNSGVVFEAIAEGGITRFLVLYQSEKPQLIGPVRSIRMYYVDWLAAFNASVAHIGGSAAALTEVRGGDYRDIDQFFNSQAYWRASDRYAPHNVYTSFAKLDELNLSRGYTESSFTGFSRTDSTPVVTPDASSIEVHVSSSLFDSSYVYNPTTNNYDRYQAGELHTDREEGNITPSVVIAMYVDEETIFEDGYRQSIKTIGTGNAVIFQNGTAIEGTWTKNSKTSQITFTDSTGADIPLVRGQTWITAVPNEGGSVTWS